MGNQMQDRSVSSQDIAAARLDRKAATNPVLARGWQMGMALVDAALKDQGKPFAPEILAAAAKLK